MPERIFYPLTSPQMSIWYTERMYPDTSISNVSGTLRITEKIQYDFLERAIQLFIKNNDGIRLRICMDENGLPQQYIAEYEEKPVEFKDFSQYDDPVKALYEWDSQETLRPFELLNQELYRFVLVKLNDNEGGIYSNFHHIIMDAWSMSVSSSIITNYYATLKNNNMPDMKTPLPSYVSFIENEKNYRESERFNKDREYWEKTFEVTPEATVLKTRKTNTVSTKAKRRTFVTPKKFTQKLRDYCSENKITPYPLFLSALSMYINRVTEKDDVIIGTPLLNRLNRADKNTVGMYISVVPLRIPIKSEVSFSSFSKEVLEVCSSVYRHQRFPYELILKQVREKHGPRDNLYDIVLSYQNTKFEKMENLDYSTRWHFNGHQSNSLTIHINDRDDDGALIIDYDYHSDLYYDKEIDFIHQHVLSLLWHALDNHENMICKIEMLPESEKRKILYEFNNTEADYPRDKTIHQLFEEQVRKTPDNVAVIFEDKQLTYRELNEKANSLARLLREKGLKREEIVGIMVHRSLEMIIGMLAVLKAGGAYLYIDSKIPDERINLMLIDCRIGIVLTQKSSMVNKIDKDVTFLDLFNRENYIDSDEDLFITSRASNLAYVIFTSGSTGIPKAVMIEHKSVNNFLCSVNKLIGITSDKTVISLAAASFDIFVFELFSSLISGACLILTSENERTNAEKLLDLFKNYSIDIVHGTPSVINLLLDYNENIFSLTKTFIIGGECFTNKLLSRLKNSKTHHRIFNGYGPTECTVGVTFKELTYESTINIGKPISNTHIYILDDHMNLVPIGITGEIYIGGDCLARGYFNQYKLTKERFIDNPFFANTKLYKTGDLAKWLAKGEIEFIGRVDHQVKINGYRIELDEINNHIMKIEGIRNSVVIEQILNKNKKILCAYLVSDRIDSSEKIRKYLLKVLPEYMIPSCFLFISSIPVTQNGKIATDKLPKPFLHTKKGLYVKPHNKIERVIQEIWENVLYTSPISINDSIYEIGGDSLDMVSISSIVYKRFKVEFPAVDVNKYNTIKKMARYINQKPKTDINTNSQLCLLKDGKTNIFFIHAGNGEIGNYIKLSQLINNNYACWGIKMDFKGYSPLNLTIYNQALIYVSYITDIQPDGPYYLAGWCIGGTIAFEIANILEKRGNKVEFLGLFNSIAPQIWENTNKFTIEGEINLIQDTFSIDIIKHINKENISVYNIWNTLIKLLNEKRYYQERIKEVIPKDMVNVIPRFESTKIEDIIRFVNGIRSLHLARALYIPQNKIETKVVLFSATDDNIIKDKKDNYYKWNQYCINKVIQIDIKADHNSIFDGSGVIGLSNEINKLLENIKVMNKKYA